MHKKQLVSVIIPAYNEEKCIEKCLISIKNQTYQNIELIVIDDGSTDNTKKIAKKYVDVLLTQNHQGPGIARNKSAKIAKGSIIMFIDADMYADKNFVKNLAEPILKRKVEASYTLDEYIGNPENIWSKCFVIDNNLKNNSRIVENFSQEGNFYRAFKKSTFIKLGGFDISKGYEHDKNYNKSINFTSSKAKNAILYHVNPDSLKEVFLSARWVGRSASFTPTLRNTLKYSIINSIRVSIINIKKKAPLSFFVYKVVFDLGILSGIYGKNKYLNFSK